MHLAIRPRLLSVLSTLVLIAGWSGCSTTYEMKVDAISHPSTTEKQSYRIRSKNPQIGEDTLRHKEAADFIRTALSGRGLYEAPTEESADMIVELDYGIEPPRVRFERISRPVYAQVGGGVRYVDVIVIDAKGNQRVQTMAVFEPPRTELIGFEESVFPVTVYEKYLLITARENKASSEGRPAQEVWSVHVSTEDESKDLRKYIPVMASASIDYIGKNSNERTTVTIKEADRDVTFVKKGM